MKPDICCYKSGNVEEAAGADPSARIEFGYAEFFVEVKPDPSHDIFVDPPSSEDVEDHSSSSHDFFASSQDERFTEHRNRAFGQHVLYATELFARQHRVSVFSISMSGSRARFLRWDRAGCVVSTSFDVREEPELLCDFLWRFSQTSEAGRGHDPTVIQATSGEETIFHDSLRQYLHYQVELEDAELDRAITEHYKPGHVAVVHVLSHGQPGTQAKPRLFIVSRPMVSPLYLTGRATRGFWAVEKSTGRLVFLKDTWRSAEEIEGDIIERLNEKGVRNVPSLVCHGDVPKYTPHVGGTIPRECYQLTTTFIYLTAMLVKSYSVPCPTDTATKNGYRRSAGTGFPFSSIGIIASCSVLSVMV